jgi:hypothetical protein
MMGHEVQRLRSMYAGVGIGFRSAFAAELLAAPQSAAWIEVHPENYVGRGGRIVDALDAARSLWPVGAHGLSMSLGNETHSDDRVWVRRVRSWLERLEIPLYTEHLCWSGAGGAHSHDLLPLPRSKATIARAVDRIHWLQDELGRPVAIENVSEYVTPSGMDEAEFVGEVAERSDALLLLDVNNITVNAANAGFDALEMLNRYPLDRVVQVHVAGHLVGTDGRCLDTHAEPLRASCLELLAALVVDQGPVPVLLERDGKFPPFAELVRELRLVASVLERGIDALSDAGGCVDE